MNGHALGRTLLTSLIILLLTSCGGGGGQSAPDVDPGPAPSGGTVPGPDPIQSVPRTPDFADASGIIATITGVTISSAPVVDFTMTDDKGVAIVDLTSANVRFTIAKLIPSTNGSSTAWQSYINREKIPEVIAVNPSAIQATSEQGGDLTNHGDGTYSYTFVTDIAAVTDPLAVTYEPDLTHRVAIQFSGGPPVLNPTFDWVPSSGATTGILTRDIVAIESCNTCHDPLALHGGGRRDTKYCVTCHNPGTTEPNSLNTVDFKVMVHKIHRGASLPSVVAGGEYVIYGFRDSRHDYSHLVFPQDIRNCTNCHAGTGTGSAGDILTTDGDNWNEVPTRAACGSCHDDVDFTAHNGGQFDDSNCLSCHSVGGDKGAVAASHRNLTNEFIAEFEVNVLDVTNSGQGDFPVVTLSVTNPLNGDAPYDILNDPEFDGGRLNMGVAWDTADYNNVGNGGVNARYQVTNVLTNAVAVGDGTFTVVSQVQIPDGTLAPFIPATGSGAIIVEGRARKDVSLDATPNIGNIPLTFGIGYFSINEPDGQAVARRQPVDINQCNVCHGIKINHGSNRANDTQGCVGCHNPRNTDKVVRDIAATPPTDGKDEESIDFKRLIHGIHASGFRENPLQVVGFGGRSTHVFDEEEVHFPGNLSNCRTCHREGAWRLPLADTVLASTIDTGADIADPTDDLMITATASACSSCHDGDLAQTHMEQNGADFTATASSLAGGTGNETCAICHGPGRIADLDLVHGLD